MLFAWTCINLLWVDAFIDSTQVSFSALPYAYRKNYIYYTASCGMKCYELRKAMLKVEDCGGLNVHD
jgi:hypothetical protein